MKLILRLSYWLIASSMIWSIFLTPRAVWAADQSKIGGGNATAIKLSQNSPLVQSANSALNTQARQIKERTLASSTLDIIDNSKTCIQHRIGVTETVKTKIIQDLLTAGLVDSNDDKTFPNGLIFGVFPPLLSEESRCPQLPQPFSSAPGGSFGGHHSYPGGLVIHELFNNLSGLSLSELYREIYGQHNRNGLPIVNLSKNTKSDILIRDDLMIAAPIWHDWAKAIVLQWNADGTEFSELNFGGNGKTDNYNKPGDSKTAAHHILGLAEAMKRKLSPEFVITQASAHAAPSLGNEYKVVNWLRTAAILAQIDPVATGYLYQDNQNQLRLPPLRQLGEVNLNAVGQTNFLAEYALHNLSDADFVLSIPAVTIDQEILKAIAPSFGYNPSDTSVYNVKFRNPILSYLSAERLFIIYTNQGLKGVRSSIERLRQNKII
jgi:hypothetical protein